MALAISVRLLCSDVLVQAWLLRGAAQPRQPLKDVSVLQRLPG